MSSIFKLICVCSFVIGEVHLAAIPMWEYLSKDEKMSYLYSMFATQVEDYCEFSSMHNCNHELLKFGLGKLKDMPEDHLDTMDPYQRGAHTLIWDSMMEGHEMMHHHHNQQPKQGTTTTRSTTTAKPNSYDDQSFYNQQQDYQSDASAKIETVVYQLPKTYHHQQHQQNNNNNNNNNKFVIYKYPQYYQIASGPSQYYQPPTNAHYASNNGLAAPSDDEMTQHQLQHQQEQPLQGPMVVKVHLDGTPVKEQNQLPHDEDLRQYMMSKVRLPNL